MNATSKPSGLRLTGPRKAAILMATMGEEVASAIYRNLPEKDVQALTRELAELGNISAEASREVLEEYSQMAMTQDYLARGGVDFATRSLVKAFGEESARSLLRKVAYLQELSFGQLDSLRKADPQQLAKFLESEHPQTITLILAHLEEQQASILLMRLPEQTRADCVRRLAQLRQFSPKMAERVSVVLNRRLQSLGEQRRTGYSGVKSVADLLNRLDSEASKTILETIEQSDAKLAINIRNLMFTFEDLRTVDIAYIREWLGAMDKKTLAIALKNASQDLRSHIFRAMSSRAVEMLKEDMEALNKIRNKEIAIAQQEAVTVMRKLETEGKVVLKPDGNEE